MNTSTENEYSQLCALACIEPVQKSLLLNDFVIANQLVNIDLNERLTAAIQVLISLMEPDQEQVDKIFIPFYTTKKNGTGIGLSLCKQIMMMHKGTIRVKSIEGKGTAILLQFA